MAKIGYYGTDEIIQKLDKLGINVNRALVASLSASCKPVRAEMLGFMQKHHDTGETERSFTESIKDEGNRIELEIGFDLRGSKPGLPALFLNYGVPGAIKYPGLSNRKIEPSFFIENAIDNNREEIKRVQQKTLEKIAQDICGKS